MRSGWRIADPEFATSPTQMMSGEGAYLHGGRWNSKGTPVVYLGTSLAQAAMELLVNLQRYDVLRKFHKMEVTFDEALMQHIDLADLPADWTSPTLMSSVQMTGDAWINDASSVILQVPSAALPGEYNYLFNPAHPDANKVVFGPLTEFRYDPRLLKN